MTLLAKNSQNLGILTHNTCDHELTMHSSLIPRHSPIFRVPVNEATCTHGDNVRVDIEVDDGACMLVMLLRL